MPRPGAHRGTADAGARFPGCASGAAAVEFAVLVPPFALGLLMMVDVGLALFEKMQLTQALRPATQLALAQVADDGQLTSAVRASLPGAWSAVTVKVSRSCECAGAAASCNVLCQDNQPPAIFTTLAAGKGYTPILLPPFSIATAIEVRTR